MPKDPILAYHERNDSREKKIDIVQRGVAMELVENEPELGKRLSKDELDDLLRSRAEAIVNAEDPRPVTKGVLGPVVSSVMDGSFSPLEGMVNAGMDSIPKEIRPGSLKPFANATGLDTLSQVMPDSRMGLPEGEGGLRLDSMAHLAQTGGPALAAKLASDAIGKRVSGPLKGAAKLGDTALDAAKLGAFGPNAQMLAASAAASSLLAAPAQIMERAQEYIDHADSGVSRYAATKKAFKEVGPDEIIIRMVGEGMLESLGGAVPFGVMGAQQRLGKYLGVDSDAAKRIIDLSNRAKIDLGLRNVTTSRLVQKLDMVLGKFPAANKSIRVATERQAGQFGDSMRVKLSGIAPELDEVFGASVGDESLDGVVNYALKAMNRSQAAVRDFKATANSMYAKFLKAADGPIPATVTPLNTTISAARVKKKLLNTTRVKEKKSTRLFGPDGKQVNVDREELSLPPLRGAKKEVADFLDTLIKMEDDPSVSRFMATTRDLEDLIGKLSNDKTKHLADMLIEVKQNMKADFRKNLHGPQGILALKEEADNYYKSGMQTFAGPAARRLRKIDRSFGKVTSQDVAEGEFMRDQGMASPEMFIKEAFRGEDPGVVKNIYDMLVRGPNPEEGKQIFKQMTALHLNEVQAKSMKTISGSEVPSTDVDSLRRSLGLSNPAGDKYKHTKVMFDRAGINIKEYDESLLLAARLFGDGIPDINQMISRRVVLGGMKSGLRTFVPGTSSKLGDGWVEAAANITQAAAAWLLLRGAGKTLAEPGMLKHYRILLDPNKNAGRRLRAVQQLLLMDTSFLVFDSFSGGRISDAQNRMSALMGSGDVRNMQDNEERTGTAPPMSIQTPLPEGR